MSGHHPWPPPRRGYTCWLDADGEHVWQRHHCGVFLRTSKLPHGHAGWRAEVGQVVPSINCKDCGLHVSGIPISQPPIDWSGDAEFIEIGKAST